MYLFPSLRSHLFLFSVSTPSLPLDDTLVQFAVLMVIPFDGRLTPLHFRLETATFYRIFVSPAGPLPPPLSVLSSASTSLAVLSV